MLPSLGRTTVIDFFVGCLGVLSLAIAALALASWRAGVEYDKWERSFSERGIKTALEPVVYGGEVVGYTLVAERRSNRL